MNQFQWQFAQVKEIVQETHRVKTFTLFLPQWQKHLPGQHYDIRLTSEDGYQAQRSYSIASSPEEKGIIKLTVEIIEGGEISTYLHGFVEPGDRIEVRGPIGGYFVWRPEMMQVPLLLVAGGSGIVPLMAMLRHRAAIGAANQTALLFSIRSKEDVIFRTELEVLAQNTEPIHLCFTYTRQPPLGWMGDRRRIDSEMLRNVLSYFTKTPLCFICGPSGMVEQVANTLVGFGLPESSIRTERFGPT
jgi:ferredoxin-NADP reductase